MLCAQSEGDLLRPASWSGRELWVPLMRGSAPEADRRDTSGGLLVSTIAMSVMPNWPAFQAQLRGFVASRTGSASDADDLVQLILERALRHAGDLEDQRKAASWLFAIARNAIRDHYRTRRGAPAAELDTIEDRTSDVPAADEDERAFVLGCMQPLLELLDPGDQQLLRWADMEDRSMQFIADALGLSLSATKSRVQRARKDFIKATQRCCSITLDARGRVTELTPKDTTAPACGSCSPCSDGPDAEKCQ